MTTPQHSSTAEPAVKPSKFSGLAWSALILGIVGLIGSPIIILNNLTAVAAGVGVILGIIALFGTKKILAGIGTVLCILAIVVTVSVQGAAVEEFNEAMGGSGLEDVAQEPVDTVYQVGQTHEGDNVSITVANPRQVTTSATAAPAQNAQAIAFDVTIKNTSSENFPVVMLSTQATAGDRVLQEVFDSEAGFNGGPSTELLPGKSITYPVAFVEKPGEVVMQISSPNGDTISFTHAR